VSDSLAALRRLTASQLLARAAIVGAAALALFACARAAGAWPPSFAVLAFATATVLTATFPDTHAGGAALLVFGWIWVVHVDATASPWLLLAAPALVLFHAAAAFVAGTPAHATIERAVIARWSGRFGLIVAVTAAVWGFVAWLDRVDARPAMALTVVALIVLCGAATALSRSTGERWNE
jgi:hypothetical protein